MIRELLKFNKNSYFFSMVVLLLPVIFVQQEATLQMYLEDPLVIKGGQSLFIETFNAYRWLAFLLMPLMILLRSLYTTTCLFIGRVLSNQVEKTKFSDIFNISLKSDIIFCIFSVVGFVLLIFFGYNESQIMIRNCTLAVFFDVDILDAWFVFLLASISIFEVFYCLLLALCYAATYSEKFLTSLKFVFSSYGLGLVFYISVATFVLYYIQTKIS
ncbi:MAG: hypothetical protein LBC89_04320 [Bacteroidales bacterium]|jgi:hypothetical protein|nr:hypothetical protein [Bacteroidales bacterium]